MEYEPVKYHDEPRLVFKKVTNHPRTLQIGMEYYPGCFTPTGLREHHIEPIVEWCKNNNCGRRTSFDKFTFSNDQELTVFLLRWSLQL